MYTQPCPAPFFTNKAMDVEFKYIYVTIDKKIKLKP